MKLISLHLFLLFLVSFMALPACNQDGEDIPAKLIL